MKVELDIGDNGEPVIRFNKVVGSNSTDQKVLQRFIDGGFSRGLHVTSVTEGEVEKGDKRQYEIRINDD